MRLRTLVAVAAAAAATVAGPITQPASAAPLIPTVSIADAGNVVEGEGGNLKYKVTVTDPCDCVTSVTVTYSTMPTVPGGEELDASKWLDYEPVSGWLNFTSDGPMTQIIEIVVINDHKDEAVEDVGVKLLSAVGARITDDTGVGTLSTPWCVTALNNSTNYCSFVIDRAETSSTPISVRFSTIDGTARAGEDFRGVRGSSVTIPAGATSAEISVWILPSPPNEPEEYFDLQVDVLDAAGTRIDHGRSTVTIRH